MVFFEVLSGDWIWKILETVYFGLDIRVEFEVNPHTEQWTGAGWNRGVWPG